MKIVFVLACVSVFGCSSVSAEVENVCVERDVSLPAMSSAVNVNGLSATVSRETDQDISSIVGKVDDFASVDLSVNRFVLSTTDDFSFVEEIKSTATQNEKTIVVSDDQFSFKGRETKSVSLHVKDNDGLIEMLRNGSVQMEVLVSGKIPGTITPATSNLCVGLKGELKGI